MSVMTVVVVLGLAWLIANVTLVLMLRWNARVRERQLGRSPRQPDAAPQVAPPSFGKALGRP